MNIVILGHRGCIGGVLYRHYKERYQLETAGFSSKELDLARGKGLSLLERELNPESVLIFCAALPRMKEDSPEAMQKNIAMAANVAAVLKSAPVRQCLFFSSIDVYGDLTRLPLTEADETSPTTCYGWAKRVGEFLLSEAVRGMPTRLAILRLAGVYGATDKAVSTVNTLAVSAFEKSEVTLFGDGSEERDYVWVEDLAPLTAALIEKKVAGVFNVATGKSSAILEIVSEIEKVLGKPLRKTFHPGKRPPLHYQFDIRRLQEAVGPLAWTPLSEGIRRLHEWRRG